jgi:hypothetical protein
MIIMLSAKSWRHRCFDNASLASLVLLANRAFTRLPASRLSRWIFVNLRQLAAPVFAPVGPALVG